MRQRGIGLLLTFVILIMAAGYVLSAFLSPSSLRLAQDRQYADILNRTREAIIAATVSASGASERPGNMPRPDVVADTSATKNYNGDAETGCFDLSKPGGLPLIIDHANVRCLGRFPWRTFGLSNNSFSENDPTGTMPWYAVSGNLAFQRCVEFINPDILAFTFVNHICPANGFDAPTSLPYPWLTVRDARGVVVSDRVAVVIIVPGPAINGQVRPSSPNLSGSAHYLDSVTVTVTSVTAGCAAPPCTMTFSNADLDNDFIQADRSETFNDRLIYVTIDELMEKIEARAGQEIRAGVERFRQQHDTYPWLAPFADPTNNANRTAVTNTRVGLIPFYETGKSFVTEFSWTITGGTLDPLVGTVNANVLRNPGPSPAIVNNGTCVWTNVKTVKCDGEILNPQPTVARRRVQIEFPSSWTNQVVTKTAASTTSHAIRQVARPNGTLTACLTTSLTRCVIVTDYDAANVIIGKSALRRGTGSLVASRIRFNSEFPAWVTENRWHEFSAAAIAPGWVPGGGNACPPCMTGNLDGNVERADLSFVVLMAGAKLAGQNRPSPNSSDYFDSANNRDLISGQTFDRQNILTATFNDRLFY